MKIRYKLLTTTGLFTLLGLVSILLLTQSHQLTHQAMQTNQYLVSIEQNAYQLALLAYDTVLHPGEQRAQSQWHDKYQQLLKTLNSDELKKIISETEHRYLTSDIADVKLLYKRLLQITSQQHDGETPAQDIIKERESLATATMLGVTQKIAGTASSFRQAIIEQHNQDMHTLYSYALTTALLATSILVMLSLKIFRGIFQAIQQLLQGTDKIVKGDLGFRIHLKTNDEIEDYANAFNNMVARLHETMASRDELNSEIRKHQETEEQLRKYRVQLESRVQERTDALQKSRLAAISIMEDANYQRQEALAAKKEMEIANRKLQHEILYRQKVEGRLRENEDSLKQAIIAADAANKAKSIFLANMSHELRTPLNAILGFSEMMTKDERLNNENRQRINVINRSGEHLLDMINDVLDLSKIESGRMEVDLQPCNLENLLIDIEQMISARTELKNLLFNLEMDPQMEKFISTDVGKLRQILINLLGNSVKYTNQGGISLRARTMPLEEENTLLLQVEVEDSGIGIAEDQLDKIFIPFVQATRSDQENKGTGLGLAITHSLVELLKGSIKVESKVNSGSIFTLSLPVGIASEKEVIAPKQKKPTVLGLAPNQPQWNVLVVDDNADNRLLLSSLMTRAGFTVKEAHDGLQAVDLFKSWHPDFIWMDMRMPNLDGYEATRQIRDLPGGKDIKIVAITASAFKEQKRKILDAGCDGVVRKPYRTHEVYEILENILGANFLYDRSETGSNASIEELSSSWAEELPKELQENILASARRLDTEELRSVIEDSEMIEQPAKQQLLRLIDNFRFDLIIDSFSKSIDDD